MKKAVYRVEDVGRALVPALRLVVEGPIHVRRDWYTIVSRRAKTVLATRGYDGWWRPEVRPSVYVRVGRTHDADGITRSSSYARAGLGGRSRRR